MDSLQFDNMTRALATGTSRRRVLAGLLGGLVGLTARGSAAAGCREAGRRCTSPGHCCSGICDPGSMTCACPPGTTNCRGACAAPAAFLNDIDNCGGCQVRCPAVLNATRTCAGGSCGFTCIPGFGDCDGAPTTDCEMNLSSDVANCGGCGIACPLSSDPCQVAVCQGGVCGFVPGNDGAACDDHNTCTEGDTCLAGVCTGRPVTCANDNPCLTATCDPATGCGTVPKDPGVACGTGPTCANGHAKAQDTCDGTGACQTGATTPCGLYPCTGSVCGVVCTSDAECVATAHCDGGVCYGDLPNGQPCDEPSDCASSICSPGRICCQTHCGPGEPCLGQGGTCGCPSGQHVCSDGTCKVCCGDADCASLTTPCTDGVCDPAQGCTAVHKVANTTCGSATGCRAAPMCNGTGTCVPAASDSCPPCRHCVGGTCVRDAEQNGLSCPGDGNTCFANFVCDEGVCDGRNPKQCEPFDECHGGVCNPQTGGCDPFVLPDGTSCASDQACSINDTCQGGVCTDGTGLCGTDDPCKTSRCTDQRVCLESYKPAGTSCGAGDACTGPLICDLIGNCIASERVSCGECTVCDPETGSCVAADEGETCTGAGDRCFDAFVCRGGSCVGENPTVCSALNQCHAPGTCDPDTGLCSNPELDDGTSCNDGSLCTTGDHCFQGECVSEAVVCDQPNDLCHRAVCDPATGSCVTQSSCIAPAPCRAEGICDPDTGACTFAELPEGTECDDGNGNACTFGRCIEGQCWSGRVFCDQPEAFCQYTECNPANGSCVTRNHPDGTFKKNCLESHCASGHATIDPRPISCECGTCDPTTNTCVGWEPLEVCESTCTSTSICNERGECVPAVGVEPCTLGTECSDLVCDTESGLCVDTGAHDGQGCGGLSGCGVCLDGACVSGCPACTTCQPLSGECVPCEHCCNGMCGKIQCDFYGTPVCSFPQDCCPDGTSCNGGTCCVRGFTINEYACCASSQYCCISDFGGTCCAHGQACVIGICIDDPL